METNAVGRLLTIQEVADRLQVSVAAIRKWRHEGRGPTGFRIGKHVRFDAVEVERWIAEKREQSRVA